MWSYNILVHDEDVIRCEFAELQIISAYAIGKVSFRSGLRSRPLNHYILVLSGDETKFWWVGTYTPNTQSMDASSTRFGPHRTRILESDEEDEKKYASAFCKC